MAFSTFNDKKRIGLSEARVLTLYTERLIDWMGVVKVVALFFGLDAEFVQLTVKVHMWKILAVEVEMFLGLSVFLAVGISINALQIE